MVIDPNDPLILQKCEAINNASVLLWKFLEDNGLMSTYLTSSISMQHTKIEITWRYVFDIVS
jgi:hypothetical protein